ncbi:CAAX farnesyltransferase (FTase) subunit beta [Bonamia ostreae]|uniref:CAAX farnesyltransferase (FTase) subunit beta n=1 Tax=Bonamia ostreae TaxID=126728 RepID=A0ABV2AR61_9EUKA
MSDISSKTMFDRKNCFSKVYKELMQNGETPLDNQKTARAVAAKLSKTKKSMIVESSKPCFLFWGVNSICFLDQLHNHKNLVDKSIEYLESISLSETTKGAFSGGYMQMPDLANTFASVCVVVAINNTETRNRVLNKRKIKEFLMRMKNEDGSFSMHENGESDCRSIYSAVATASMLNILSPELTKNVVDFIEKFHVHFQLSDVRRRFWCSAGHRSAWRILFLRIRNSLHSQKNDKI